ncbi:helix-turn-helix domain-containing protein [Sphingobium bisphenolivorans]|uniref:helix-turn-helix domain-containing protein n=1 Tax=Sphingobium bisphenolivorans TaxID=1335760 RepID=UPI0003B6195B|nr:helix-turn-helix domain-containing protein [Sphingobium bisphenolivorans]
MAGGAKNTRRGHEPRHIRLYHSMTGCAAWRDLSGNAVKLLVAMMRLEHGNNNGDLFMSARHAAELIDVSKNTAHKLLVELEEHGFIRPVDRGFFQVKGGPATSWRLTWLPWPGHGGPTREFEKWEPSGNKTRSQKLIAAVPEIGTLKETSPVTVSKIGTASTETSHFSDRGGVSIIGTQTVSHGRSANHGTVSTGNTGEPFGVVLPDDLIETEIRMKLKTLLQASPAGTQSRLAEAARIPGGTLSKFLNDGKALSSAHRVRLQLKMAELEKSAGASRAA